MICVSIGRGRHKHIIAEHRHLVDLGVKLVELRLDYINGTIKLKRLLNDRPGPVLVTCRREQDGGRWAGMEAERQMVLRTAIVDGADYVDIEEDIAANIPRYGTTKRIISYHNFRETPADIEEIHERMCKLDPDIVKLATMANSPHDNIRMLKLAQRNNVPTIALCMGDMGTPTRILGAKYGVPITYSTYSNERTLAPGQIGYQQMREVYGYDQINAETEIYGVIADPIGHSLSPQLHNACFRDQGSNRCYLPFRVPREHLASFIQEDCPALEIKGLSVTIPHKETIVRMIKKPNAAVQGIGAANTVLFDEGGPSGFNSDCDAALASLSTALPQDVANPYENKTALVLGSGGVAKAIAWGLKNRGVDVIIASRTDENADDLAKGLGCRMVSWEDRGLERVDILINGTPVGMHPNVNESPIDKVRLRAGMVVFDTVYNPEQTLLIKEARQRECRVVTGVDMFVRQAALQYQLFTGSEPSRDLMRDTLKKITGAVKAS
ncbi:shikimate dehydrogenase [Blastopirellula marina]|uniref:Multifunctional fusion protein n=1 Tax=Blastopirellula marina DSM 3645 TaxID=314230 RepID=A4A187_9BACT|nr:shikimate dehydrogenase [Blastopirellula marina]EAQ77439.1 3-dehydroquinate dehydratase / shikimate 5-dehydrogenase precursor [Blastopirellula marina DSM 3645]